MPNIIEQQDLLKGLTDQRLAALMSQPTADIPPFLVAAEAQRRQSIRAQFQGDPQKNESVVDSLTRQMAGTPEDVNANPPAPPAPAGIAAIPGADQGMANGGMVKRYDTGGGVFRGRFGAQADPNAQPYNLFGGLGSFIENMQKYGINPNPQQREELEAANVEADTTDGTAGSIDPSNPFNLRAPSQKIPVEKTKPAAPRNTTAGTQDTSLANKYKAQREEFRKRAEELMGDGEPSSWEKAQKWFDVSQAFLQPGATVGETVADAISAFGGGMAAESAQRRQAQAARDEYLLNMDMEYAKQDQAAEVAAAERALRAQEKADDRAFELEKLGIPQADSMAKILGTLINNIDEKLANGDLLSEEQRSLLLAQKDTYANQLASIMGKGGFVASPTREDLEAAVRAGK